MTAFAVAQSTTSLKLGPHALPHPFVQAALSGYSDWPMRALARQYGAAYTVAEVMIDRFVNEVRGTGKTRHHLYLEDTDRPAGAQLMGSDPLQFGPAARRLQQAGFDVIDINFGCPVRSAIGGCRGGYHLGQPEVALEIVARVRDAVPPEVPVTLKMRRGLDDSALSRDRFFRILDGAFERGIAAVTVHGRTVAQKYVGPSNWDFLKQVKEHAGSRTILGSGDLFTAADCVAMLKQTGVDGVTIARGAIGNPWIFRQALAIWQGGPPAPEPTIADQRLGLEEHLELIARLHGAERAPALLRRFGFQYSRLHPRSDQVRNAFASVRTPADFRNLLDLYYTETGSDAFPSVGSE